MKSLLICLIGAAFLSGAPKTSPQRTNAALFPSFKVATCTGTKACRACKNCKYCKHCAKEGGSCGVCK